MSAGTLTKIRIWHAARDAYHCAFRMLRIASAWQSAPLEMERLRILDMFLLAPTLLHKISMPRQVRAQFEFLGVPEEREVFESLPSVAAMFQELRIYQNAAANHLLARDIFKSALISDGIVELNNKSLPKSLIAEIAERNKADQSIIDFLTSQLSTVPLSGDDNIYKRAGLPARHLIA